MQRPAPGDLLFHSGLGPRRSSKVCACPARSSVGFLQRGLRAVTVKRQHSLPNVQLSGERTVLPILKGVATVGSILHTASLPATPRLLLRTDHKVARVSARTAISGKPQSLVKSCRGASMPVSFRRCSMGSLPPNSYTSCSTPFVATRKPLIPTGRGRSLSLPPLPLPHSLALQPRISKLHLGPPSRHGSGGILTASSMMSTLLDFVDVRAWSQMSTANFQNFSLTWVNPRRHSLFPQRQVMDNFSFGNQHNGLVTDLVSHGAYLSSLSVASKLVSSVSAEFQMNVPQPLLQSFASGGIVRTASAHFIMPKGLIANLLCCFDCHKLNPMPSLSGHSASFMKPLTNSTLKFPSRKSKFGCPGLCNVGISISSFQSKPASGEDQGFLSLTSAVMSIEEDGMVLTCPLQCTANFHDAVVQQGQETQAYHIMDIDEHSNHAAVSIQSMCRGFLVRARIRRMHENALQIQRRVRGHLVRRELGLLRAISMGLLNVKSERFQCGSSATTSVGHGTSISAASTLPSTVPTTPQSIGSYRQLEKTPVKRRSEVLPRSSSSSLSKSQSGRANSQRRVSSTGLKLTGQVLHKLSQALPSSGERQRKQDSVTATHCSPRSMGGRRRSMGSPEAKVACWRKGVAKEQQVQAVGSVDCSRQPCVKAEWEPAESTNSYLQSWKQSSQDKTALGESIATHRVCSTKAKKLEHLRGTSKGSLARLDVATATRNRSFTSPTTQNKNPVKSVPCIALDLQQFCPELEVEGKVLDQSPTNIPIVTLQLSE